MGTCGCGGSRLELGVTAFHLQRIASHRSESHLALTGRVAVEMEGSHNTIQQPKYTHVWALTHTHTCVGPIRVDGGDFVAWL